MKLKTALSILIFNLFIFTAFGQNPIKVGYADIEHIVANIPDTRIAKSEMEIVMKKLSTTRDSLLTDYRSKVEYHRQTLSLGMADAKKKEEEDKLLQLKNDIQDFEIDMQKVINYKYDELLQPIYAKVGDLISDVAKENGYTHVINSKINGTTVMLYAEESTNIDDLVIAKAKE
ncbi:OmpH family outer membrane protein [Lacinutrix chionoecetis]